MTLTTDERRRVGVVVIGRNEGGRLTRCLGSLVGAIDRLVYVDSGSTDDSRELARALGVAVVELDASAPFTAARARNAGLEHLVAAGPGLDFVQFIDGDCEMANGWLARALQALDANTTLGVVCGTLRERDPNASIYHRLSDMEWNEQPPGVTDACGGVAMIRVEPLRSIGGFNAGILAGEEAEMCVRLRRLGFTIERLDAAMALHDIGMTEFRQWWRRAVRAGYAYARVAPLHPEEPFRRWAAKVRSNWFWGAALPGAIGMSLPLPPLAGLLALGYPLLFVRVYRSEIARGIEPSSAALQALFVTLGKFPAALGQAAALRTSLTGKGLAYRKDPPVPRHSG